MFMKAFLNAYNNYFYSYIGYITSAYMHRACWKSIAGRASQEVSLRMNNVSVIIKEIERIIKLNE